MAFVDAIKLLNSLKRSKVIRDYAIHGAVAATAYMEPIFTADLDVIVLVSNDDEYLLLLKQVSRIAEKREGMTYTIAGVPVQLFPTTTKPLYLDTLKKARIAKIGNLGVKVASPEHLVLLYLEAFRTKDKFRVQHLLPIADENELSSLLELFDDEKQTLAKRLKTLL